MRYLIIDDEKDFANLLAEQLQNKGFTCKVAHNSQQALQTIYHQNFERIVLDLKLGTESGLALIGDLIDAQPDCKILLLTGYASISTAVSAIKLGAHQYLCKPASLSQILEAFDADSPETQTETLNTPITPPSLKRLEWEHIQKTLDQHHGNVSQTAKALGMHRRTLQRRLQKFPVRQ